MEQTKPIGDPAGNEPETDAPETTETVPETAPGEDISEPVPGDTAEETPAEPDSDEEYYAALERSDLSELSREFPELAGVKTLAALKNPVRYGALRDLGLTPREAYLAVGGRRALPADNRSHLRSAVPSGVGGIGDGMSMGELAEARALFEGLSDAEIRRLYKKVK